ncbi:MAG: phosphatidylserine/phosphatidylglycerophosphate/cardiolipin synthase family protein [Parachlamydiales bacterium]
MPIGTKNSLRNALLFVLALSFTWLFFASVKPSLPIPSSPVHFYSNQTRHDIKLLFCSAILNAKKSIDVKMYGITDPDVVSILGKQAAQGIHICIEYDRKASSAKLLKTLPKNVQLIPSASKGLMHRKILVLDEMTLFLGSANLTTASLRHHDNLVLGLYCPPLATYLRYPTSPSFSFTVNEMQGEIWLLPDKDRQALSKLISTINSAKKTIKIAMFTLTHPEIADALIAAQLRGVHVEAAVDYYTAKGASEKCIEKLRKAGICIILSQGQELLHHKWALLDERVFIMGSANWTKAAFQKNDDFLIFFSSMHESQINFLKKLWKNISIESF